MVKKGDINVNNEPCALSSSGYEEFLMQHGLIRYFHLVLPHPGVLVNNPHVNYTAMYLSSVIDGNLRFPLTSFFSLVLRFNNVGLSQIYPPGVIRLVSFEMVVVSDLNVFRFYFKINRSGTWFTFEKRKNNGNLGIKTLDNVKGVAEHLFFGGYSSGSSGYLSVYGGGPP